MKKLLTVSMLMTGLLPLFAVVSLSAFQAAKLFEIEAQSRLEGVLEGRKVHLEDYLHGLLEMNESLAENSITIKSMQTFDRYFKKLNFEKTEQTRETAEAAVLNFYSSQFAKKYQSENGESFPVDVSEMLPTTESGIFSQWAFIASNPNVLGEKDKLQYSKNKSAYNQAHKKYHPFFSNFQQHFDLYDIFLIDADTRTIVYSVFKEIDFGQSLSEGPLRDSGLAKVVDKVLSAPAPNTVFQDMQRYQPSFDAPASFVATPIYDGKDLVGVLAIQLPADRIEKLSNVQIGMGETGQSLLVGEDNLLRAQPRLAASPSVLIKSVDLESVRLARSGQRGVLVETDGEKELLTAYAPLDIPGFNWTLLVQMETSEVLAGSYTLLKSSMLLVGLAFIIILIVAWQVGRVIFRRIGGDPSEIYSVAEAISQGDLQPAPGEEGREGAYAALIQMRSTLGEIISEVSTISAEVSQGAEELTTGSYGLSSRTESQAEDLQSTAANMEQITSTVKKNASNADAARSLAKAALSKATKGGELAHKTVDAMDDISNSSSQIVEIIGVIDSIAFQTNLLALNAAVEAARAGEQGRGFAVVATEVRQLASRSAAAAKEIKGLIEDSASKVTNGTLLVRESGDELTSIVESVAELSELVDLISVASAEQSKGVQGVSQSLSQIDTSTQQNAALAEEAAATSESMRDKARSLTERVNYFNQ